MFSDSEHVKIAKWNITCCSIISLYYKIMESVFCIFLINKSSYLYDFTRSEKPHYRAFQWHFFSWKFLFMAIDCQLQKCILGLSHYLTHLITWILLESFDIGLSNYKNLFSANWQTCKLPVWIHRTNLPVSRVSSLQVVPTLHNLRQIKLESNTLPLFDLTALTDCMHDHCKGNPSCFCFCFCFRSPSAPAPSSPLNIVPTTSNLPSFPLVPCWRAMWPCTLHVFTSDESLTNLAVYFRNWHMFREYMNNIAC